MNTHTNIEQNLTSDEPKISFLEAFYGVLFSPKKIFQELYNEDTFTVIIYGFLAVVLSNLGKIDPSNIGILSIVGIEFIGFLSWFFVGIFIFCFSTVFKTPNNNLGRLLGFTGLSGIPFLLLTPINLIYNLNPSVYMFFQVLISIWSFILFWISLAKSFQLEAWRVFLMAIIPFFLGIFLFTFLIANIFGMMFTGMIR
ncbi:MAG: hypothetical protein A3B68_04870 [Candidatus Melainabacteria bacterium RIFCSPHIGHO2_02_FULL_34_12]|nr:MAG: hypothetical protein A3B68_04870 [Candidatus Melainabacteria bacterium RIFCSPHIGHO2_02_FULL_34_12]